MLNKTTKNVPKQLWDKLVYTWQHDREDLLVLIVVTVIILILFLVFIALSICLSLILPLIIVWAFNTIAPLFGIAIVLPYSFWFLLAIAVTIPILKSIFERSMR